MVVVGVEEDKMAAEVWVHQLEGEGRCESSKECSPHHFVREVVRHLRGREGGDHSTPLQLMLVPTLQ